MIDITDLRKLNTLERIVVTEHATNYVYVKYQFLTFKKQLMIIHAT